MRAIGRIEHAMHEDDYTVAPVPCRLCKLLLHQVESAVAPWYFDYLSLKLIGVYIDGNT